MNPFDSFQLAEGFEAEANALLGNEATAKIMALIEMLRTNPHMRHFEVRVPLPETKEDRMLIHTFVREKLPFLDS